MGQVGVVLKIMPEGLETDLGIIRSEIESKLDVNSIEEVPIAFGLKAIKVSFILDDAGGEMQKVEDTLLNIEGVRSVEVEQTTLI